MARPGEFNLILTLLEKADTDEGDVIWKGRLTKAVGNSSQIELVFDSNLTALKRPGLQLYYQKGCPLALYGAECSVDKRDWVVEAEVLEINGNSVTVLETFNISYPEESADWFTAGMCELGGMFGFISKHTLLPGASLLKFGRPFETLFLHWANLGYGYGYGYGYGEPIVKLYPGCNRTMQTCIEKFDNLENFGAFPIMPTRTPYNEGMIF